MGLVIIMLFKHSCTYMIVFWYCHVPGWNTRYDLGLGLSDLVPRLIALLVIGTREQTDSQGVQKKREGEGDEAPLLPLFLKAIPFPYPECGPNIKDYNTW